MSSSSSKMDDEIWVPEGWTRTELNGRILYVTPAPCSIRIYSKSELTIHQKKGKFLDVLGEQLVFSRKRRKKDDGLKKMKKLSCGPNSSGLEVGVREQCEDDLGCIPKHCSDPLGKMKVQALNEEKKVASLKKLANEQAKLAEAVSNLTIDPAKKVNHKSELEKAAKKLNEARLSKITGWDTQNFEVLKEMIDDCGSEEDLIKILWTNPQFQSRFASLFSSKLLEQMLSLESNPGNPLKTFPVDINCNVYADIINFGLENASDVILLLLSLMKKHETPISTKDVMELAFTFANLAESVSSENRALKKIKSICLKSSGLTNAGLDSLATVGAAETSRSFRNDRDLLASISEEIVKQYARKFTPQFCFDNLDICINKVPHHLTLNFLEFEQDATLGLNTESKSLEEMLEFFTLNTLLIQSDPTMFEHFQSVTALTLARLFGKEVKGMEWMRSCSPKHYTHPNSNTSSQKSLLHTDKPMYLQETKNSEMLKIMENLQLEYLNLVGEQAEDRERYFEDIKLLLSVDCDVAVREAAEARIKLHCLNCGVMICHGDYLTFERFESCKRLRQGSSSSFERFEFMEIFRIGMFHLRMNKTIQVGIILYCKTMVLITI